MNDGQDTLQQVKDILASQSEPDTDRGEDASSAGGEDAQAPDVGRDGSGPGELGEQATDEPEGLEDDTEGESPDDIAATLKDVSERLGLDVAELYDVEIPLGKGESVTLGELKDNYKDVGPVQEAKQKLAEERDKYERSIMQTRAELNGILAVIPPELREAVVQSGRQYNSQWETTQREQVLEAIPEWREADQLQKDRDAIVAIGAEYGFSEPEMQYTNDARTLRMLRDFTRMKAQLDEMRTAAKTQRNAPAKSGKQNTRRLTKRRLENALASARSSSDMGEKRKAVQYLMQGNE